MDTGQNGTIFLLLLVCLPTPGKPMMFNLECSNVTWFQNRGKLFNDCDIFEENLKIHMNKLVSERKCVNFMHIGFGSDQKSQFTSPNNVEEIFNKVIKTPCNQINITIDMKDRINNWHKVITTLDPMACFNVTTQLRGVEGRKPTTIEIDITGVFKNHKLRTKCLNYIGIHNSNGVKLPVMWLHAGTVAEVTVDRCEDERLTVFYIFRGGQSARKVVKVPRTADAENCQSETTSPGGVDKDDNDNELAPVASTKPTLIMIGTNTTTSMTTSEKEKETDNKTLIAAVSSMAGVIIIMAGVIGLLVWKSKNKEQEPVVEREPCFSLFHCFFHRPPVVFERNSVYGTYHRWTTFWNNLLSCLSSTGAGTERVTMGTVISWRSPIITLTMASGTKYVIK